MGSIYPPITKETFDLPPWNKFMASIFEGATLCYPFHSKV